MFFSPAKVTVKSMKQYLDITNRRYNEQISSAPWYFVKSRFHCSNYCHSLPLVFAIIQAFFTFVSRQDSEVIPSDSKPAQITGMLVFYQSGEKWKLHLPVAGQHGRGWKWWVVECGCKKSRWPRSKITLKLASKKFPFMTDNNIKIQGQLSRRKSSR